MLRAHAKKNEIKQLMTYCAHFLKINFFSEGKLFKKCQVRGCTRGLS